MKKQKALDASYQKLLLKINNAILKGQKLIERQKMLTYHEVGGLIDDDLLKNKKRAGYGEKLYERLEKDTGINKRTLEQVVKFYREIPKKAIANPGSQFNWSKFRALFSVKDPIARSTLIEKIEKENLSSKEVVAEVKKINAPKEANFKLKLVKGRLGLGLASELPERLKNEKKSNFCLVDLGFKVVHLASCENTGAFQKETLVGLDLKMHRVFELNKDEMPKKESQRFTFVAYVKKVIDGDTLLVDIDLNQGCFIEERLRLRGIDAPEIKTEEGKEVKKVVEQALKDCPFIVVQTTKGIDMYARYLADVLYLPFEENPVKVLNDGNYLNQELIHKGIVVMMGS